MTIEEMLAKDFSALTRRLDGDGFAERALARLKGAERLRLVAVAGAGAAGAAIAASQFEALVRAISNQLPALAEFSVGSSQVTLEQGMTPLLMSALLLAAVGGATSIIIPGSR